jgi:hypothetical protein
MFQQGTLGDESSTRESLIAEMRDIHIRPITGDDHQAPSNGGFVASTFRKFESSVLQPIFGSSNQH